MGRLSKPKKIENEKLLAYIYEFKQTRSNDAFNAIVKMIEPQLEAMTNKFFYIPGNNRDDIKQEALSALASKAIPDYDENKGSFIVFAKLCVQRHIITLLKSANNNKQGTLNVAVSLNNTKSSEDDEDTSSSFGIFISTDEEPVIDTMIRNESMNEHKRMLKEKLTDLENEILELYLKEMSYDDIVTTMNKRRRGRRRVKSKTIDNALCRIKHKAGEVEESLRQKREGEDI